MAMNSQRFNYSQRGLPKIVTFSMPIQQFLVGFLLANSVPIAKSGPK
jgi:hypothetical protein